jgi:hypothetical protein
MHSHRKAPSTTNLAQEEEEDAGRLNDEKFIGASVPPPLERQSAVPSQPGAFLIGGDTPPDAVSVVTGICNVTPGLIEATLVEETWPEAPVYKGHLVVAEDDPVVTLSKKQLRYFLLTFTALCCTALVFSMVISLCFVLGIFQTSSPQAEEMISPKGYWFQGNPEALWKNLSIYYPYITHHMAILSIVNPVVTTLRNSSRQYEKPICTPLREDGNRSDLPTRTALRAHREGRRTRLLESDRDILRVSLRCGNPRSQPPTHAVIVVHDQDGNTRALNGDTSVQCTDATYADGSVKYNEVTCAIPSDGSRRSVAFFFSCFSRLEVENVAAVQIHEAVAQCYSVRNTTEMPNVVEEHDLTLPEVVVTSPPEVALSMQRLCRTGGVVVLQDDIIAENEKNRTRICSHGGNSDFPFVCRSQDELLLWRGANNSVLLGEMEAASFCHNAEAGCYGIDFLVPNVTIYDQLDDDNRQCSYTKLEHSLLTKAADGYPMLKPLDNATLVYLQEFMQVQALF